MNERQIFEEALAISDSARRQAFLDRACGADATLRKLVETLLASHAPDSQFLEVPALQQLNEPELDTWSHSIVAAKNPPAGDADGDDEVPTAPDVSFLQPSNKPGSIGTLGHYEILQIVGQGAFGIVFKAFDEKLHRLVAIKAMNPQMAATSPPRKRFLREARAAAAIKHENVVQVHSVEEQPLPYMAMEYIDGQTLQQKLNSVGPLSVFETLHIGRQIASGLAAAHALGLIHRDIKPGNILLEQGAEQKVKITDFGLARAADDATLTRTGVVSGTPLYMSPEQATGAAIDLRSDLFSLGSVLYVMASGRPPFRAPNLVAVLKRVVEEAPRPIPEIIAEVPDWLCAIIVKLHAKSPEHRFGSAKEVAELLGRCLADVQANRPVELPADLQGVEQPSVAPEAPTASTGPLTPTAGENSEVLELAAYAAEIERPSRRNFRRWPAVAATLLMLFAGVGLTEATGVTRLASTVIRLTTGSGTLVIETDDPGVKVTIDGKEVQIQGAGIEQLTLKPGQYQVAALKDGQPVAQQLVTITRGGREVVKVTLEGIAAGGVSGVTSAAPSIAKDPDRHAAEYVLSIGGAIKVKENGEERDVAAVAELPKGAFELTVVKLPFNRKVSDAGLAYFQDCRNLTYLQLAATQVGDAGLAYFQDCRNLTFLELGVTQVTDAGLAYFQDCKNLTQLNLNNTQVSDAGLAYFQDCKNLTGITLSGTAVTDAGLAHFQDCKHLTYLNLGSTAVTDAGLAHFKDCRSLTYLDLGATQVSDAGLAYLQDCKNLTQLNLVNTQVSGAGLAYFKECKNLATLYLQGTQVSDAGLAHLKDFQSLTNLELRGSQVGDAGLAYLRDLKHLQYVDLSETQVTDAGLAHLKDFQNLMDLGLSGTQVGDSGLSYIMDCKSLNNIALERTKVSDAGLADLARLPNLTRLYLRGTRISHRGYEQLKGALLKSEIAWSETNRSVAEGVLAVGGTVEIGTPGQAESRPVATAADLPADYFQVRRVSLAGVAKPLGELIAQLSQLQFPEFDRLQSLDLSGIAGQNYAFLAPIHGLQDLTLANTGLTDVALTQLPKLPALERLVLDGNDIRGAGLKTLAAQPELTDLTLANVGLTDDGLAQLPKLPALKRLVLDGNDIRGTGLKTLAVQPELTDLSLGCPSLGDLLAKNLAELKQIKRLSLAGSGLGDAGIKHLAGLTNLETLDLRKTKATPAGVAALQESLPKCRITSDFGVSEADRTAAEYVLSIGGAVRIKENGTERDVGAVAELPRGAFELTVVNLNNNQKVTDEGLVYFRDCRNLTHLELERTNVTDAGLANFQDCKNLTGLNLYGMAVTDAGLAYFQGCRNLTWLDLSQTRVTDACLAHLKDCQNLTYLALAVTQVTDAGLAHLKDYRELSTLCLNITKVSDAGLVHLRDLKHLQYVVLADTQVTDAGLAHLSDLKHVERVVLNHTRVSDAGLAHLKDFQNLTDLQLSSTQVGDLGLSYIMDCKSLNSISLDRTKVSDAGLADLARLPNLTRLDLRGTRISLRGYEQLKAALPNSGIAWSETNRSVAEGVLALGGTVEIGAPGQAESRPIAAATDLPAEFFQVRRVSLAGVTKPLGELPGQMSWLQFPEFDRLQSLDLSGITGQNYAFLAPIHGLQDLTLANVGLTDDGLAQLPKLPALKRLVLDGNSIRGAGLKALAARGLQDLTLANVGLTDAGLAQLPKLPLKRLVLDGNEIRGSGLAYLRDRPELIDLSLGCPSLGDLLAKNLAELKQIKRLSLAGSGLGDAGIKHLAGLTNLETLDLRKTKATPAGVAALQEALPKCKIASDFAESNQ